MPATDFVGAAGRDERESKQGQYVLVGRMRGTLLVSFLMASACSSGAHRSVPTGLRPASTIAGTCVLGIDRVPASEVPRDVAAWANDRAVIGAGALWTERSALAVPPHYQQGAWYLKFPWYTRPFGLPTVTARRVDGPGMFWFSANRATDATETWVASNLVFSTTGCWEVTSSYRNSSLRFRIRVGAD
jgi:hypothetical protein